MIFHITLIDFYFISYIERGHNKNFRSVFNIKCALHCSSGTNWANEMDGDEEEASMCIETVMHLKFDRLRMSVSILKRYHE